MLLSLPHQKNDVELHFFPYRRRNAATRRVVNVLEHIPFLSFVLVEIAVVGPGSRGPGNSGSDAAISEGQRRNEGPGSRLKTWA